MSSLFGRQISAEKIWFLFSLAGHKQNFFRINFIVIRNHCQKSLWWYSTMKDWPGEFSASSICFHCFRRHQKSWTTISSNFEKKLERSDQSLRRYNALKPRTIDEGQHFCLEELKKRGRYFQIPLYRLNRLAFADVLLA